jgi:hypothetical protein
MMEFSSFIWMRRRLRRRQLLVIAVYYSRKSYNSKYVFSDMVAAWAIQKIQSVDKIGDYNFRL